MSEGRQFFSNPEDFWSKISTSNILPEAIIEDQTFTEYASIPYAPYIPSNIPDDVMTEDQMFQEYLSLNPYPQEEYIPYPYIPINNLPDDNLLPEGIILPEDYIMEEQERKEEYIPSEILPDANILPDDSCELRIEDDYSIQNAIEMDVYNLLNEEEVPTYNAMEILPDSLDDPIFDIETFDSVEMEMFRLFGY